MLLPLIFRRRVVLRLPVTLILLSFLLGMPLKETFTTGIHNLSVNAGGMHLIAEVEESQNAEEDW